MPVQNQNQSLSERRNKKLLNVNQSSITYVSGFEPAVYKQRTKGKTIKTSGKARNNHELLNSLGLQKSPLSTNHYRKRLATHDSRIFIVKLPPNSNYYSYINSKAPAVVNSNEVNEPNAIEKSKKVSARSYLFYAYVVAALVVHFLHSHIYFFFSFVFPLYSFIYITRYHSVSNRMQE